MRNRGKAVKYGIGIIIAALAALFLFNVINEKKALKQIIERLTADSRVAHVLVSDVTTSPQTGKTLTTIKFMEFDAAQRPLPPKYFTFSANIIQFQSLVIRFDDFLVKSGHPLKGKSAYVFMKVFALNGDRAEVFELNKIAEVPSGYRIEGMDRTLERRLWRKFWDYALDARQAKSVGIRNAQVEAPGTKFVPGVIYTIVIEHDGGMRIDTQELPRILKGERLNF